jgi:hypothetical protein
MTSFPPGRPAGLRSRARSLAHNLVRGLSWVAACAAFAPAVAGATDINLHGTLDVVMARRGHAYDVNTLTRGDNPFDAYTLRLFADAAPSDRLHVFTQVVLRDATIPYVDGAYLDFTPVPGQDLHFQAGKVPWPIGTYAPRSYANKNPLIGAPLMYQYHTSLVWYETVPSTDVLLANSWRGQYGVDYEGYTMGRGMTLVDDSYWDVGVTMLGSMPMFEYAMGAMAGTPGWGSTSQDENTGKSLVGRVGFVPLPGLRLGASGAYGPYLVQHLEEELPAGSHVGDYHQQLAMADLELLAGHIELRSEAAYNVWETPTVGDLEVRAGYVELKYALPVGAWLAGRFDVLRFGEVADSTGARRPWDSNVNRYEAGVGFRFTRNALAKVIWQRNELETVGQVPGRVSPSLVAAQIAVGF